ncbi:MAG TPA: histidine phosphatase family protein [Candidatus Bacteroides pullicola]|uniref:Multiple inositol polyphosphate phosphatase 1 n=1 Tax=Candidatus Bacteroides pullicola TaxID=2838475 RepID=A0A9D1ZKB9_9BACE|nr:histidine phosphatase family protein [Candidatus Bacteroides pullicola]
MKKTLLLALSAAWALTASAQSAWDEIRQNPVLAAGKYMAYQAPEEKQIAVPDGYEPFYLSTFARHGSRYLTKQKKYDEPLATLEAAQQAGKLTPDGQRALDIIRRMAREAQGRYGELTPKGARQHRELAARMFRRYPTIFRDGVHVDARSTTKSRAFLSMANGCVELARLNPRLNITMDASLHDVYYIKYSNDDFEELHLAQADSVYRLADSVYVHPDRLMKQLFNDAAYVKAQVPSPSDLMQQLFELDGISQSSWDMPDLAFLFDERERYDLWQRNNFEWYYEKGPSPLSGECMYKLGRNLLENFVLTADTVIASGRPCVSLRYGHDTNLAPFAALMGCDALTHPTRDWQAIADTYRTYRLIPMCGNVQLVFYRKTGSDDILVRVLLNERDVTLPVRTDKAPFYPWEDLRAYWMSVVQAISFPEQAK